MDWPSRVQPAHPVQAQRATTSQVTVLDAIRLLQHGLDSISVELDLDAFGGCLDARQEEVMFP